MALVVLLVHLGPEEAEVVEVVLVLYSSMH
jgi:hypothetical protein